MAIRLITGRLQQGSRYCAKEQQILQKTPGGIGKSAFLCLVSALVSQPVLWCSVMWRFVLSVTRSGNHLL